MTSYIILYYSPGNDKVSVHFTETLEEAKQYKLALYDLGYDSVRIFSCREVDKSKTK